MKTFDIGPRRALDSMPDPYGQLETPYPHPSNVYYWTGIPRYYLCTGEEPCSRMTGCAGGPCNGWIRD
ncbi:MAG: hypothetical protein ACLFWL_12230 [Candidatus Brocadiia bacterium]